MAKYNGEITLREAELFEMLKYARVELLDELTSIFEMFEGTVEFDVARDKFISIIHKNRDTLATEEYDDGE